MSTKTKQQKPKKTTKKPQKVVDDVVYEELPADDEEVKQEAVDDEETIGTTIKIPRNRKPKPRNTKPAPIQEVEEVEETNEVQEEPEENEDVEEEPPKPKLKRVNTIVKKTKAPRKKSLWLIVQQENGYMCKATNDKPYKPMPAKGSEAYTELRAIYEKRKALEAEKK